MLHTRAKMLVAASALTIGALALTGCTNGGAGSADAKGANIVYVVPNSWATTGAFQENLKAWEAKSGNTVEVQAVPDEQYDSTVQTRLTGGEGIDIFAGQDSISDPASVMLEISGQPFEKRMNPDAYTAMKAADGKVYGFPSADGLASFGVFYNKDVFTAAGVTVPRTLGDLTSDMEAIKAAGKTPLFLAGKDGWTLLQHRNSVNALMFKSNKNVASELEKNTLTWAKAPGFDEQYTALAGWAKNGLLNSDVLTATYEQSQKALVDGDAAMIINGSWVLSALRELKPNANIGFFALPNGAGDAQIGLSRVNIMHVAAKSKVAAQAKDLLNFMVEKEQVAAFLAKAPGIPAFTDVTVAKADPVITDIQGYVDNGQSGPAFDTALTFPTPEQDLIASYQELLAGRVSAAEFATAVDKAWSNAGKTAGLDGFK